MYTETMLIKHKGQVWLLGIGLTDLPLSEGCLYAYEGDEYQNALKRILVAPMYSRYALVG